eukprot:SAG31_NODE_17892_length_654_cov_1.176577_2_plen_85_part_01
MRWRIIFTNHARGCKVDRPKDIFISNRASLLQSCRAGIKTVVRYNFSVAEPYFTQMLEELGFQRQVNDSYNASFLARVTNPALPF